MRADFVTVAVRTGGEGHGGISLLVVDRGTPGFTVSRRLDKMGWRCSDTAELSFDGVRVPASNLVGEEGSGFLQIMQQFQSERLGLAVQAYATAQRCLDLTLQWVKDRETFGRPLVEPPGGPAQGRRGWPVAPGRPARAPGRRWSCGSRPATP